MASGNHGNNPKKRRLIKVLLIGAAIFVAFILLVIGCAFSVGAPAMKAGENFVMAISAGQTQQAYDSASAQFKQEVDMEKFEAFINEFPILTKVKSVTFNSFNIESDAYISGTITATDGQVSPVHVTLVKEDGVWKVIYIDLNPLESDSGVAGNVAAPGPDGAPESGNPPTMEGNPPAQDGETPQPAPRATAPAAPEAPGA